MKTVKNILIIASLVLSSTFFSGCESVDTSKVQHYTDSPTEGTIHISVDESFKPIIDSQIQVFESQYPKAHIIAEYKSEADCFKDLDKDSTRMIIVTRGLTKKETDYFENKILLKPRYGKLAWDAIAVVVNNSNKEHLFSPGDIKKMLAGTSEYKFKVVLDGLNATSTVRYALDSILRGDSLGRNVEAAKNSEGVIDYVANDPNAIGLVGVSWLGKKEDSQQLSFSDKVTVASMLCTTCDTGAYVLPYLANIATARYPFYRPLYYILKEDGQALGGGFTNFLNNLQKGQLIFKRAYLLPAKFNYDVRNMSLEEQK